MLALQSAALSFAPALSVTAPATRATSPVMETLSDLKELAPKLNPVVGYWNPLGFGEDSREAADETAIIGYLRHSEIKHGRVAMAAFVGFIVQSNVHFPWPTSFSGLTCADIAAAGGPAAQWDALPTAAKLQIIGFVGGLELWSEIKHPGCEDHYMRGGKPGAYPSFASFRETFGHPIVDLYDPFGLSKNKTPEEKARGLLVEINNGRLAMLGIMGFCAAASIDGSVPALDGLVQHYDGEIMAPFSSNDVKLPMVEAMLNFPKLDSVSKLSPYNW